VLQLTRTRKHAIQSSGPIRRRPHTQPVGWLFDMSFPFILSVLSAISLQGGDRVLIRDVHVARPEVDGFIEQGFVLIEGERIVAVGEGVLPPELADARVLEGRGRYLIPGLIDAHVHLGTVPGMSGNHERRYPELAQAWFDQLPRSLLYFGYTTVIELGGRSEALEGVRAAELHPDVHDCHFPLVLANGYGMVFEPPETRFDEHPNFLYDSRQADAIPASIEREEHSPEACVRRVAENGGICIKTHWEDGFGGVFSWPTPSASMIRAVLEQAHNRGLPVVLHANSLAAWEFGARVEVDQLVHGLWHWGAENNEPGLPRRVRAVLDRVLEQQLGFMPTMQVLAGERSNFDPEFLDDPRLAQVVPSTLLAWYGTPEGQWFREDLERLYGENRELLAGLGFERFESDAELAAVSTLFLGQLERTVAYLAENGGRLLFGSDTPSSPSYANPAGYNGFLEMQRLHAAGVPLGEILLAATLRNAQAFGLEGDVGSIEPGKLAHMLLLARNPLETILAYDSIQEVVVRGQVVSREALSAAAR
jgi:imidazolonepropionase-like amidohydrolase